jgi:hypothetical protein
MFGEFRARGFVINFAIDVENNKSWLLALSIALLWLLYSTL